MTKHVSVLPEEVKEYLLEPFQKYSNAESTFYFLDCTLGGGGHTNFFLETFRKNPLFKKNKVLAFDQDLVAIRSAKKTFALDLKHKRLELVHDRFSNIGNYLKGKKVLGILADLGFSTDQLSDPKRGLSFKEDGPLDMRLDLTKGMTCRDYLSKVSEKELEEVLRTFGEERFSRQIASSIITQRREGGVPQTTKELVHLIVRAIPSRFRHGKIHAATRSFQALRIAVNHELDELDQFLGQFHDLVSVLERGARAAVISFHSLEDRRVKQKFRQLSQKDVGDYRVITKKPITPKNTEIDSNPRARSAKMRIIERL